MDIPLLFTSLKPLREYKRNPPFKIRLSENIDFPILLDKKDLIIVVAVIFYIDF